MLYDLEALLQQTAVGELTVESWIDHINPCSRYDIDVDAAPLFVIV